MSDPNSVRKSIPRESFRRFCTEGNLAGEGQRVPQGLADFPQLARGTARTPERAGHSPPIGGEAPALLCPFSAAGLLLPARTFLLGELRSLSAENGETRLHKGTLRVADGSAGNEPFK